MRRFKISATVTALAMQRPWALIVRTLLGAAPVGGCDCVDVDVDVDGNDAEADYDRRRRRRPHVKYL